MLLRTVALGLAWACAVAAVAGFVMPWAHVDLRQPDMVKRITGTAMGQQATSAAKAGVSRLWGSVKKSTQAVTDQIPGQPITINLPSGTEIPSVISGVQVPQLANSESAGLAMAIFELLTGSRQYAGAKSYAVYALPGLALLGALLLTLLGGRRSVAIGVAAVFGLVAAGAFFKLLTTNTSALFVAVTIGKGIWLTLWAYVGIALAGVLYLAPKRTA